MIGTVTKEALARDTKIRRERITFFMTSVQSKKGNKKQKYLTNHKEN